MTAADDDRGGGLKYDGARSAVFRFSFCRRRLRPVPKRADRRPATYGIRRDNVMFVRLFVCLFNNTFNGRICNIDNGRNEQTNTRRRNGISANFTKCERSNLEYSDDKI